MSNKSRAYWVWLSLKCKPASSELSNLISCFDGIEDIYKADFDRYTDAGISERLALDLTDKSLEPVAKIFYYCSNARVGILCYDEDRYPASLRALKDPPAVLYYVGELPDLNNNLCIAMVGKRSVSEYGKRAAYKISYEAASAGAVIVSGMALGVDGIAACAAMAAGGKTVAVLGSGIDIIYPKEHCRLYDMIRKNGAVITEYPPATEPFGSNFPQRNRIISGLSQGTVVVNADMNSGALITAKKAILQGRDIYAVPGNIDDENSEGANSLIRDGAQAVLCGYDIIKNYASLYRRVLDIQRLRISEARSDYDDEAVRKAKVAIRTFSRNGSKKTELRKSERKETPDVKVTAEPKGNTDAATERKVASGDTRSAESGDKSAKTLASLNDIQRKIFNEFPIDSSVTLDYFTNAGYKQGEVMSALTVLEIKGLINALPGALYTRK